MGHFGQYKNMLTPAKFTILSRARDIQTLRRTKRLLHSIKPPLHNVAIAVTGWCFLIKRVANSTYIITPYNVDVMGDLIDELENNGMFM